VYALHPIFVNDPVPIVPLLVDAPIVLA
jgi:hypothetical protein